MFIGSFHRVVNKNDIESRIPTSSSPCIIYVEDEKKLYEKNTYGMVTEYLSFAASEPDFTVTSQEKSSNDPVKVNL